MKGYSRKNLMHILEAKDKNGFSGLFLAISRKDKNVVTSILNVLPKLAATHHLDNEQVYKFLSAKIERPAMFYTMLWRMVMPTC